MSCLDSIRLERDFLLGNSEVEARGNSGSMVIGWYDSVADRSIAEMKRMDI